MNDACASIIAFGVVILTMYHLSGLRLNTACASITTNDLVIVMVSVLWHQLITAVRRACASIIAFGVVILTMSAVSPEPTTIERRMREYYCEWLGHCNGERLVA